MVEKDAKEYAELVQRVWNSISSNLSYIGIELMVRYTSSTEPIIIGCALTKGKVQVKFVFDTQFFAINNKITERIVQDTLEKYADALIVKCNKYKRIAESIEKAEKEINKNIKRGGISNENLLVS